MDRSEQPPPGPGLINPTPDANRRAADQTQEMIGHRETLARQAAGFGELAPGCRNSTGLLPCTAIPQDRNLGWWPVNGGQSRSGVLRPGLGKGRWRRPFEDDGSITAAIIKDGIDAATMTL